MNLVQFTEEREVYVNKHQASTTQDILEYIEDSWLKY